MRDAFGRLLTDPQELTQRERVDIVRGLAGTLQASPSRDLQWLGACITRWLHSDNGGDLVDTLGLRPARGDRRTAQQIVRTERRARLMTQLSLALGGDRPAARVLSGRDACPPRLARIVDELRAMQAPTSAKSIARARGAAADTR